MRLIDADHLKKWMLARWQERNPQTDRPFKAIEILDQIDREMTFEEQHWIPCSERLPEVTGSYLVTVHPNYIMPGGIHVDMLSWFNGKWWFDLDGQDAEFPDPIIAWMPLPEPYEGESGENT